jgi:hypothetical protein
MRTKRKGKDYEFSDDEDDDGRSRRRWNKKQRKMRREEGKDGIARLRKSNPLVYQGTADIIAGERNAFADQYENNEDSDPDDDELEETQETPMERSPGVKLSYAARMEMLQKVGQANKRVCLSTCFRCRC